MKIFMNGEYMDEDRACITPFSNGFMYGFGVFETIRVRNHDALFLAQHYKRLNHACSVLSLEMTYSRAELGETIGKMIGMNAVADGFVKIVCSRGAQAKTDIIILTGTKVYKKEYDIGLKLCLAASRRNEYSKLVGVKCMNYAENIMEKECALSRGFEEALFLNTSNQVAEGCVSNIFWVKEGTVYTPSSACGILKGTARQRVIGRCKDLGIPIHEGRYALHELYDADELFVTNSLMEIMPVRLLDDRPFDLKKYEVVPLLMGSSKNEGRNREKHGPENR